MNLLLRYAALVPRIYWVAILLRIIWAVLIPVIPLSDSFAYDTFAINIWQNNTYGWEADKPYSYWPVGTSGIYSLFYSVFGHVYWPIVIFHIAISIGIIYFTKTLCERFFDDKRVAMIAGWLLALWPTMIFYCTILGSELLYMFFSLAGMYWFTQQKGSVLKNSLIAGLLFAAAYYVRPLITVAMVICIFTCAVMLKERWQSLALKSLISFAVLALLVAPWAYRNYHTHNAFVPMSTNSGAVFWMGNQPGTNGGYVPTPPEMANMDTHERSQILKARAMEYIKEEPLAFISRTLKKFITFHTYETIGVTWNEKGIAKVIGEWALAPLKIGTQLFWMLIIGSATIGLVLAIVQRGFWWVAFHPFTLLWSSNAAIHAIIVSQDRYHIPSVTFIVAFSAIAIIQAFTWYKNRS